jgi:hypothetical protein
MTDSRQRPCRWSRTARYRSDGNRVTVATLSVEFCGDRLLERASICLKHRALRRPVTEVTVGTVICSLVLQLDTASRSVTAGGMSTCLTLSDGAMRAPAAKANDNNDKTPAREAENRVLSVLSSNFGKEGIREEHHPGRHREPAQRRKSRKVGSLVTTRRRWSPHLEDAQTIVWPSSGNLAVFGVSACSNDRRMQPPDAKWISQGSVTFPG